MEATTCFHWSQPFIPHCPASPQTLVSNRTLFVLLQTQELYRWRISCAAVRSLVRAIESVRSIMDEAPSVVILRDFEADESRYQENLQRSLDAFSDEEFFRRIQELTLRFQHSVDAEETAGSSSSNASCADSDSVSEFVELSGRETGHEPPHWPRPDELVPTKIERRANSFDLPVSLRMIKLKR